MSAKDTPTSIGPWAVEAVAGIGATATVYRAKHHVTGQLCAVKWLHENVSELTKTAFRGEIGILRALSNPSFLRLHDEGEYQGRRWAALDFVDGQSLEKWLAESRPPLTAVLTVFRSIAEALADLHRAGFVHRDLKPANLYVGADATSRVLDLGIAAELGNQREQGMTAWRRAGTPRYISPEQIVGGDSTPATDVFALGICLFEAVTGRHPFEGDSEALLLTSILTQCAPRASALTSLPAGIDAILSCCLAKSPAARYASMSALAADLAQLATDPQTEPATLIAGKQLGIGRGWMTLPGRASESRRLLAWLFSRRATVATVLIRGMAGSGRTALLDWVRERILEHGAAELPAGTPVLIDDLTSLSELPEKGRAIAVVNDAFDWPEGRPVLEVPATPLGPAAIRTWARRDLGIGRLASADLEFLQESSGGRPKPLASLLRRWNQLLLTGTTIEPGQLEAAFQLSPADQKAIVERIGQLGAEPRLLLELLAFASPVAVELGAIAAFVDPDPARLEEMVVRIATANLGVAVERERLIIADASLATVIRAATEPGLRSDLRAALLEVFADDRSATTLARRAELLLEEGRREEAVAAGWTAASIERQNSETARFAELIRQWAPICDRPTVAQAEDVVVAAQALVEVGESAAAYGLLAGFRAKADEASAERLDIAAATIQIASGRGHEARGTLLRLAAKARRSGQRELRARCLTNLAVGEHYAGRSLRAHRILSSARELIESLSPERQLAVWISQAGIARLLGDIETARTCLSRAWSEASALGAERWQSVICEAFSMTELEQGRVDQAETWISRGLDLARRLAQPSFRASLLHARALAEATIGELAAASRSLRASNRWATKAGVPQLLISNDEIAAELAIHRQDWDAARRILRRLRKLDPSASPFQAVIDADLALCAGEQHRATELLGAAEQQRAELDEPTQLYKSILDCLAGKGVSPIDSLLDQLAGSQYYSRFRAGEFRARAALSGQLHAT